MKAAIWMTAICAASATAAAVAADPGARLAIVGGMLGPLVAVAATWMAVERTFRGDPSRVTGLLMTAFLVKMLGFALYVIVALKVLALPARPFGVSFLCYFIGLYAAEALLLRRLSGVNQTPAVGH